MSGISASIARLAALRAGAGGAPAPAGEDRLLDMTGFGSNPGGLRARVFVPAGLAPGAALVVVLHGCTQTAAGYDYGAGWSRLAERHGFALLFPEQVRANNANLCFNWFAPGDARRDRGEALSIRQMVEALVARHGIDRGRIFVTGLSAGGAMAAAMLATYPELFAGGAVIAGLPYGTAWSVQDALKRMTGQGLPGDAELEATVRRASDHHGPWPTLSVWHGDADATVSPANAEALLAQWRALHHLDPAPSEVETANGYRRRVWRDAEGREVVEDHRIVGMGHGTPVDTAGEDGEAGGPFMLDVGLSSTRLIAARWGLVPAPNPARASASTGDPAADAPLPFAMPVQLPAAVDRTIRDALRKAGLVR